MYAFTFPDRKFQHTIFQLNPFTRETRKIQDERLNFRGTKTVLVKLELFAFKAGSPITTFKYAEFASTSFLKKNDLATLPCNFYLGLFSVCKVANNSIVLTGGEDVRGDNKFAKTFLMDV